MLYNKYIRRYKSCDLITVNNENHIYKDKQTALKINY